MKLRSNTARVPLVCTTVCVVGLSGWLGSAGSPAAASPEKPHKAFIAASTNVSTQAEISLREQFGLQSDSEYVSSVDQNPSATTDSLGIPLLPSESAEVEARDARLVHDLDSLLALKTDSSFAGLWVDQAHGEIHLQLAGDAANVASERALANSKSITSPLVMETVPFSSSQLASAATAVASLMTHDSSIALSEIDVKSDNVLVRVAAGHVSSVTTAVDSLVPGLASAIAVQEAGPSNSRASAAVTSTPGLEYDQSSPVSSASAARSPRDRVTGDLLGGEWEYVPGVGKCTVGYSNNYSLYGTGKWFSVTAGHCGYGGAPYFQGASGDGAFVGAVGSSGFKASGGSSYCDCESVGPIDTSLRTREAIIAPTGSYLFRNAADASNYVAGMRVCVSGAQTADANGGHELCGVMQSRTSISYGPGTGAEGFVLLDCGLTTIIGTNGGDSGAPVYDGGAFMGIHDGHFEDQDGLDDGSLFSLVGHFDVINVAPSFNPIS